MTTQIDNDSNNIKVIGKSEAFWQGFLHILWVNSKRPDTYTKDRKLSDFWNNKELVNE